jgi:phenylacetic acid degradation protein paaN
VLPVAMAVQQGRAALEAAGFSPDLLTLVVDPPEGPVALELCRHPDVKIVDFTGSARFGALLEAEVRQARVYTETAGCNFALLDGTDDLDATLSALAHALCLFSSQMCTSPQNIWIPDGGVQTPERRVPVDEVVARLCAAVDAWVARAAPALCGAIQAEATLDQMEALRRAAAAGAGELARHGAPYAHPEHPRARTATPLIVRLGPAGRGLAQAERFGPMAFVLTAPSRAAALAEATADAARFGAIASFLWSMDEAFIAEAELQAALAGASLAVNLRRQLPINFTAAFSDFHVTGLNPAGTATLTDAAFIAGRFRVVQSRRELPPGPA